VAIGLDRSHDQRVTSVRVARRGDTIVVQAETAAGTPVDLELYAANERVGLLQEVLDRRVVVEAREVHRTAG
jgi:hypothetical protein